MQKTCLNRAHVAHDDEWPLSCRHIGPHRDRCTPRCMCAPNDSCWARGFTSRPHGGSGQRPPRQDDETGRESRASGLAGASHPCDRRVEHDQQGTVRDRDRPKAQRRAEKAQPDAEKAEPTEENPAGNQLLARLHPSTLAFHVSGFAQSARQPTGGSSRPCCV